MLSGLMQRRVDYVKMLRIAGSRVLFWCVVSHYSKVIFFEKKCMPVPSSVPHFCFVTKRYQHVVLKANNLVKTCSLSIGKIIVSNTKNY